MLTGLNTNSKKTKLIIYTIKEAKTVYYSNYFRDNSGKCEKHLERNMLRNESKSTATNEIKTTELNSCTYESPRDISRILNKHFSETGPNLAAGIPDTPIRCTDHIKPTESTFILKPATYAEIFKIINNLPLNKASGLDNISLHLLKETEPIVTSSLTFIINLSIVSGIVPAVAEWKHASVSPVFKEGNKVDPNNYRPILVLPVVSKPIERVVFKQL